MRNASHHLEKLCQYDQLLKVLRSVLCIPVQTNQSSVRYESFKSVINQEVINYLSKTNRLSNKQYEFRPAKATAVVMTVKFHIVSVSVDGDFIANVIALEISKGFSKFGHKGLLHELANC